MYGKVDFKEITYTHGDSFDRYMVRIGRNHGILPDHRTVDRQRARRGVPGEDEAHPQIARRRVYGFRRGQSWRVGVFLISRGDKMPYRLHYRSTGLPLVHAMDTVCRGGKIADLIAIGGTMDFVIPDIDR